MLEEDVDVVLYGATGYTGRLVAQELDSQGASFALAGRSRKRMEAVASGLKTTPALAEVSLDDAAGLRALASRTKVVASAAGPFTELGPPLFDACVDAGTHMVDTTGEQAYLRWCHEQEHRVRDAGTTVVNALGFDVVPSDMAAVTAADGLHRVVRVDLGLSTNSRLSQGTKRTMARTTGDWWVYQDGAYAPAVPGRWTRTFPVPDDLPFDTGVFIPWGDVATAPRSTGARTVRTFFLLPEGRAKTIHRTWPLQWTVAQAARVPGVPWLLERFAPSQRDGPSQEDRERSVFAIIGEAHDHDGTVQRSIVRGTDPYGLTGAATARGALALADGTVHRSGVLTPTEALGVDRLVKMLPEFELEVQAL